MIFFIDFVNYGLALLFALSNKNYFLGVASVLIPLYSLAIEPAYNCATIIIFCYWSAISLRKSPQTDDDCNYRTSCIYVTASVCVVYIISSLLGKTYGQDIIPATFVFVLILIMMSTLLCRGAHSAAYTYNCIIIGFPLILVYVIDLFTIYLIGGSKDAHTPRIMLLAQINIWSALLIPLYLIINGIYNIYIEKTEKSMIPSWLLFTITGEIINSCSITIPITAHDALGTCYSVAYLIFCSYLKHDDGVSKGETTPLVTKIGNEDKKELEKHQEIL